MSAIALIRALSINEAQYNILQTLQATAKSNAHAIATAINSKLREINPVQISYPSIRWANNLTHVFIGVKYAPKFASPGYLEYNIKNEQINITSNSIFLSAEVQEEAKTIRYVANIKLVGLIRNHSVEHESVGRIYIILRKSVDKFWPMLSGDDVPNLVVWWEMKEKYPINEEDIIDTPKRKKKLNKIGNKEGTHIIQNYRNINYICYLNIIIKYSYLINIHSISFYIINFPDGNCEGSTQS